MLHGNSKGIDQHLGSLISQTLKYPKIGTCPVAQKLLAYMETLIYIGNPPNLHLPHSSRDS